jgi:hypothetical protein
VNVDQAVIVDCVNFSLSQWLIVIVLAAGFIGSALWLSSTGSGEIASTDVVTEVDEDAVCAVLGQVSAWGSILDGSADGDDPGDVANLRTALADARHLTPVDLSIDLARLLDLAMLTDLALADDVTLTEALAAGSSQTDPERVAEAVGRVNDAIVECGHAPVTR